MEAMPTPTRAIRSELGQHAGVDALHHAAQRPAHRLAAPFSCRPMFQKKQWRIFADDVVQVVTGAEKGATGKVLAVIRDAKQPEVIVDGVNMVRGAGIKAKEANWGYCEKMRDADGLACTYACMACNLLAHVGSLPHVTPHRCSARRRSSPE